MFAPQMLPPAKCRLRRPPFFAPFRRHWFCVSETQKLLINITSAKGGYVSAFVGLFVSSIGIVEFNVPLDTV